MLLLPDMLDSWGICEAPPARVRHDPMPRQWATIGGSMVRPPALILRHGLPGPNDCAWWAVERQLATRFVEHIGRLLSRPTRPTDIRVAHPACEPQIEALRAVYNGEVNEPEGGRLPRVWNWEHEEHVWWLVELPPELAYAWRDLL